MYLSVWYNARNTLHSLTSARENPHLKIKFHICPSKSEMREKWIEQCDRLEDNWSRERFYVCSAHFTEEDYQRDLKHELLGLEPRKLLKDEAIPSLSCRTPVTSLPFSFSSESSEHLHDSINAFLSPGNVPPEDNPLQEDNKINYEDLVQELNRIIKEKDAEIQKLKEENKSLKKELGNAKESLKALEREIKTF